LRRLSRQAGGAKNSAVRNRGLILTLSVLILVSAMLLPGSNASAQRVDAPRAGVQAAVAWHPEFLARGKIVSFALARDFASLEEMLEPAQAAFETSRLRSDEDVIVHALETFGFSKSGLTAAASAWVKAYPESAIARTALGIALAADARHEHGPLLKAPVGDAEVAAWRGHFKPAEDSLREALRLRRKLTAASAELVSLLMQSRRAADGQLATDRAANADSRNYETRFRMALHLQPIWMGSIGGVNAASGNAQPFFRVNPGMSALGGLSPFSFGFARFLRGEHERAVRDLNSACATGPDRRFEVVRGMNLVGLARYDEAEAPLRRAMNLWPEDPASLVALADLFARTKRSDDALKLFAMASELDPEGLAVLEARTLPNPLAVLSRCDEIDGLARVVEACATRGSCERDQRERVAALLGDLRSWQLCSRSFEDRRLRRAYWAASALNQVEPRSAGTDAGADTGTDTDNDASNNNETDSN
jgi:tetratricopeptide (TPR) repeat protein